MKTLNARTRPDTVQVIRVNDEPKDVCDWVASKTNGEAEVGYDDDGTITVPGQRARLGDYLVWFGGRTIGAFTPDEFAENFELQVNLEGRELEIYQMLDYQLRGQWASQNLGDPDRSTEKYQPYFVLEIEDTEGQEWSIGTRWYSNGGWSNFGPGDDTIEVWTFTGRDWDEETQDLIANHFQTRPEHAGSINGEVVLSLSDDEICFLSVAAHDRRPGVPVELARLLAWVEGLYAIERASADA